MQKIKMMLYVTVLSLTIFITACGTVDQDVSSEEITYTVENTTEQKIETEEVTTEETTTEETTTEETTTEETTTEETTTEEITTEETTTEEVTTIASDSSYAVIGNKNTKAYHRTSCSRLPKEKNRVYFDSEEEANEAGYDNPCDYCEP